MIAMRLEGIEFGNKNKTGKKIKRTGLGERCDSLLVKASEKKKIGVKIKIT